MSTDTTEKAWNLTYSQYLVKENKYLTVLRLVIYNNLYIGVIIHMLWAS